MPTPPGGAGPSSARNPVPRPLATDDVAHLKAQAEEYLQGWQRAKADYANLKRQSEQEKTDLVQFANAALLMDLLPLYDHLKRAAEHVPADAKQLEWVKGFLLIRGQFQTLLKGLGLEEIPSVGQPFDPALHEAVHKERRDGVPAGQILAEAATGFKLNGRVLQPAKVTVNE